MAVRTAEIVAISALATIVTAVMALPVLQAPSQRLFGMEIVGRHHDPFTVMEQFARPTMLHAYSQPITDVAGALLTRLSDPVAAYNWLVLLSFPLSAAAAYLLARHLRLSPAGATVAALAYAFSPFHIAHAAYHLHIAQTQWIPLYLLALWRCLDDASVTAVALFCAAAIAVTLSNFYGGFIAAVITPVAVGAYWLVITRTTLGALRRMCVTVGSVGIIAVGGIAYALYAAPSVVANPWVFAFPRGDLFRYSAKWWSYLVPPIGHPLLDTLARTVWDRAQPRGGFLEQQVSLGWGIVALGVIAIAWWPLDRRQPRQPLSRACVPVLVAISVVALLCSLSPERTVGTITLVRPAALLYDIAPMFRSYARFGVVVQLMAALLAGIGLDRLRDAGTKAALVVAVVLVALVAGEYAIAPSSSWRDVLPAKAHRWAMQQPGPLRVLDCTPIDRASTSIAWLSGNRVARLDGAITDCADPNLSRTLSAKGFTHVVVQRDTADGRWFADHPAPDGLRLTAQFDDGQVWSVDARTPVVYTAAVRGFFARERDADWAWRWTGGDAAWIVVNSDTHPVVATFDLELSALHHTRHVAVLLDGRTVQTVAVDTPHRIYQFAPITLPPGHHELIFHPLEKSSLPGDGDGNADRRQLAVAFGTWNWQVRDEER